MRRRSRPTHSWQSGRGRPALDPARAPIDGRSRVDMIRFLHDCARLLRFHGAAQEDVHDWGDFLDGDKTFLLAEIVGHLNDPAYKESRAFDAAGLLAHSIELAKLLEGWRDRAQDPALARLLRNFMDEELRDVLERDDHGGYRLAVSEAARPAFQRTTQQVSPLARAVTTLAETATSMLDATLTKEADHPAHVGLLLAFLDMLGEAQAQINRLTAAHLDFYYRRVLRLAPHDARPDEAVVAFELSADLDAIDLPAGLPLEAGQDDVGAPILFHTTEALRLNHASVAALAALTLQYTRFDRPGAAALRLEDIQTRRRALPGSGPRPGGFPPFVAAEGGEPAALGYVVASPVLRLAGGRRDICVTFRTDGDLAPAMRAYAAARARVGPPAAFDGAPPAAAPDAVWDPAPEAGATGVDAAHLGIEVRLSGPEGAFAPTQATLAFAADAVHLRARLSRNDPPVTPAPAPDGRIHGAVLELRAFGGRFCHGAEILGAVEVEQAEIAVRVTELAVDEATSPEGPVDASQPFAPFGVQPVRHASFTFDVAELADKQAEDLAAVLVWANLPTGAAGFSTYYDGYAAAAPGGGLAPIDNRSFQVALYADAGRGWRPLTAGAAGAARAAGGSGAPVVASLFEGAQSQLASRKRMALPLRDGFAASRFRLRLEQPEIGFGRDVYPALYAAAAASAASKGQIALGPISIGRVSPEEQLAALPNPPFTPMLASVSVGYTARCTLPAGHGADDGRLFSRTAFGYRDATDGPLPFVDLPGPREAPYFGTLYLGLARAAAGAELSLWIEVDTDTTRTQAADAPPLAQRLDWRYLAEAGWRDLPIGALRHDGTDGLSHTGILRLSLPHDIADGRTEMPAGLKWLAVSPRRSAGDAGPYAASADRRLANPDPRTFGTIHGVTPRAMRARRGAGDADGADGADGVGADGAEAAPAARFSRVYDTAFTGAVSAILQLAAPHGARPQEPPAAFRTRVSERLRHKGRALQARDYEQIVLAEFPDIGDAKLIRRGPGELALAVAARRTRGAPPPPVGPHRLRAIAAAVKRRMPATSVKFSVRAARAEPVRARAWLDLDDRAPIDILDRIVATTNHWIAPWLADPDAPCPIGVGALDPDALIARIRMLDGVRGVAGLTIMRIGRTQGPEDGAAAPYHDLQHSAPPLSASRPDDQDSAPVGPSAEDSFLAPSAGHLFHRLSLPTRIGAAAVERNLIVGDQTGGGDADVAVRATPIGVGELRIGADFVVGLPQREDEDAAPPARAPGKNAGDRHGGG